MSVTVTSSRITISDEEVTLADLKTYADRVGQSRRVYNKDNFYKIDVDIYIINNGSLVDENIILEHTGELFQIEKGSKLQFGKKRPDGSTYNGCRFTMTNPSGTYGFGHQDRDNSGDLLLYDSHIDVWCFWSFFEGDNLIEIIDCTVKGYGRIAGVDSILKNINFRYSHGTYGIVTPKGVIKEMVNLNCLETKEMYSKKCTFYYYPKISGDLTVYYGRYGGYEYLANILNSSGHNRLEFRGSEILGGYKLLRQADNVDFFHSYRFNPIIMNPDGTPITNANVTVRDKFGDIVVNELCDANGEVDLWIPYYQDIAGKGTDILTPHTVTITAGNKSLEFTLVIDKNYINFPAILQTPVTSGTEIDYAKIQSMIDGGKTEVLDKLDSLEESVESGNKDIASIIITLGEEVNENQTIIESRTGNTRLIL